MSSSAEAGQTSLIRDALRCWYGERAKKAQLTVTASPEIFKLQESGEIEGKDADELGLDIESIEVTDADGRRLWPEFEALSMSDLAEWHDDIGAEIISRGIATPLDSEESYLKAMDAEREVSILLELAEDDPALLKGLIEIVLNGKIVSEWNARGDATIQLDELEELGANIGQEIEMPQPQTIGSRFEAGDEEVHAPPERAERATRLISLGYEDGTFLMATIDNQEGRIIAYLPADARARKVLEETAKRCFAAAGMQPEIERFSGCWPIPTREEAESMLERGIFEQLLMKEQEGAWKAREIATQREMLAVLSDTESNVRKGDEIAIIWSIDDVMEMRSDLDEEQARQVLARVDRKHDSEYGVSHQTVKDTAEEMFPKMTLRSDPQLCKPAPRWSGDDAESGPNA